MTVLTLFGLVIFVASGYWGWTHHRSRLWNWVDPLYYPLVAVGVVLLFLSNASDRRLLELTQVRQNNRETLDWPLPKELELRFVGGSELTDGLDSLEDLVAFGEYCLEEEVDTQACWIANGVASPLRRFLIADRARREGPQSTRIGKICESVEPLFRSFNVRGAFSGLVGARLVSHYKAGVSQGFKIHEAELALAYVARFQAEVIEVAQLSDHSRALEKSIDLFVRQADEAEIAGAILRGLRPCLIGPASELKNIAFRMEHRAIALVQMDEADREAGHIRDRPINFLWRAAQLSMWPYFLIIALAFKFAKGMASLRPVTSATIKTASKVAKEDRP